MFRSTTLAIAATAAAALTACTTTPPNALTESEAELGFELLFDGDSLEHWRGFKRDDVPEQWVAVDGAIHTAGGGGDLVTRETYESFDLRFDWKIGVAGNSGVFFRVDEEHSHVWETGPEYQILDDERHPDGRDPTTSAGANYALRAPEVEAVNTTGVYNRSRIVVDGNAVTHYLNGRKILSYDLRSPEWFQRVAESKFSTMPDYGLVREGHIALQDHGDPVWFKNVKIRRL